MKQHIAILLAISIFSAGSGSAQNLQNGSLVIKTETNLVQVPVVVRDKDGHAIGNLSKADFRLFDNGKLQNISQFSIEESQSLQSAKDSREPSGEPGSSTASSQPRRFVAYFADDVNLVPEDFASGQAAVVRHVDSLQPFVRAAVYSASRGLETEFTSDHNLLKKALLSFGATGRYLTMTEMHLPCKPMTYYKAVLIAGGDPGAMQDCLSPPGPRQPIRLSQNIEQITLQNKIVQTAETVIQSSERDLRVYLHGLDELITKMGTMPGERLIVLVSPGLYVPLQYQSLKDAILDKAVQMKVVISGVDARAVYSPYTPDPTLIHDRYGIAESSEKVIFMTEMAHGTGGVFLRGNNDLDLQLRRAASTPQYRYFLGFSPSDMSSGQKPHSLSVSLKSARDRTLQYRESYVVPAGVNPPDKLSRQVEESLFSAGEIQTLPVELKTSFEPNGAEARLKVTAKVDVAKLPFRRENQVNRDDLAIMIGLFDENGQYIKAFRNIYPFRLEDKAMAAVAEQGVEVRADFTVKPGKYLIRFAARDSEGSLIAEHTTSANVYW